MMPFEIQTALEHVRSHFPEVSMVIFNHEGYWQYMTTNFEAPDFFEINNLDVGILEDAADHVANTVGFPAAFFV